MSTSCIILKLLSADNNFNRYNGKSTLPTYHYGSKRISKDVSVTKGSRVLKYEIGLKEEW